MKQALTLSIVIPVYNEERHIESCLESIKSQTEAPDEVIVVDNNSTDQSAAIARRYPFVKLLQEKHQGLIPSRNTGFNAAQGDILGRINADAVLDSDWVMNVKRAFARDNVAGLTGPAITHLAPGITHIHTTMWSYGYLYAVEAYFQIGIMWGANMAIRRDMWERIKDDTHPEDSFIHEDQDLSALLAREGGVVRTYSTVRIATTEESYFYWPKLKEYWTRRWRTKWFHQRTGTYASPNFRRLSRRSLAWRSLFFVGNFFFIAASFLYYYIGHVLRYILRSGS